MFLSVALNLLTFNVKHDLDFNNLVYPSIAQYRKIQLRRTVVCSANFIFENHWILSRIGVGCIYSAGFLNQLIECLRKMTSYAPSLSTYEQGLWHNTSESGPILNQIDSSALHKRHTATCVIAFMFKKGPWHCDYRVASPVLTPAR